MVVVKLIDVGRVAADEHLFELLDGGASGPLAEADNAFVGEDFQQGPVAMFAPREGVTLMSVIFIESLFRRRPSCRAYE